MASLYIKDGTIILTKTNGATLDISFFDEVGPISWGIFWFRLGDKYGYMNEHGRVIRGPRYKSAGNFDQTGHAAVEGEEGKGFIDINGQEVCKLIYDKVWFYNNNYAKVRRAKKIFFIDRFGIEHSARSTYRIWLEKRKR